MSEMKLKTIWKFPLALMERQTIVIPLNYAILSLALDPSEEMCIWAAVDPDTPKISLEIVLVGTGHPLPHVGSYIGSIVRRSFVWHFFTGPGHDARRATEYHYLTRGNG